MNSVLAIQSSTSFIHCYTKCVINVLNAFATSWLDCITGRKREHMLGKYHLAFGITSSLVAVSVAKSVGVSLNTMEEIMLVSYTALGSLLPDIDCENSLIGRLVPFISSFIERKIGHRTLFHDILIFVPMFLASVISFYLTGNVIFLGIMFGYIGHLFLDSFTQSGICFNYFKHRSAFKNGWSSLGVGVFHIVPEVLRFKSSSFVAKAFTMLLCGANFYIIYLIRFQ